MKLQPPGKVLNRCFYPYGAPVVLNPTIPHSSYSSWFAVLVYGLHMKSRRNDDPLLSHKRLDRLISPPLRQGSHFIFPTERFVTHQHNKSLGQKNLLVGAPQLGKKQLEQRTSTLLFLLSIQSIPSSK